MPETEMMYVRLKPYNPRVGNVLRRFGVPVGAGHVIFEEARGWYEVPEQVAALLRKVSQVEGLPPGQRPAFDVCTFEEARDIEQQEREAIERAALRATTQFPVSTRAANPKGGALTSADLNPTPENRRAARARATT